MTKNELRTIKLMEMLQLEKRLDVKTIAEALEISEATARRFFAQLEENGKVIRIHGGVQLAPQCGYDYSYRVSASHRKKEKMLIGKAAAELIQDNERIFLDSGTTVLMLAEILSMKMQTGSLKGIVVLTNSISHIETVARWCKVILIGGEIRVERLDVCGYIAEKTLTFFHVNKAFLGVDAIRSNEGFMTTDERTARINEMVVELADRAYILADSSKFDKTSFIRYASFKDIEAIYTDSGIKTDTLNEITNAGGRIVVARE